MGFVGEVLKKVDGMEWYYIAGILIFISLFIAIVYRTYKMPKSEILQIKQSILDDDTIQNDINKHK